MKTAMALPVLVTGGLLALPLAVSAAAAPAAKPVTQPVASRQASTVTLITGDHVRVDTVNGKQRVATQRTSTRGTLFTQHLGKDTYVFPQQARPYLGKNLDRNLFDVTKLKAATQKNGRTPLRISYTGSATPSVPGVTITSAKGGAATGYVTRKSANAFNKALTTQFKADAKKGFPARTTLFPGVKKIAADVPGNTTATPKFPMFTLSIKATGADGKPVQYADGFLLNVDDGRKFSNFVSLVDGEARASVPAGNYALILDAFDYNEATDTFTDYIVTKNEYKVTGAGQTYTADFRTANLAGAVTTPKPATVDGYGFEWDRSDAKDFSGISWGAGSGPGSKLYVAPEGAATIGSLHVLQTWDASQGGANPYSYSLVSSSPRIPLVLAKTFKESDLAQRNVKYYTDGPARNAGSLRYAVYPWQFFVGGTYELVKAPLARTEYIGGNMKPQWGEGYLADNDNWDDPGFWDDYNTYTFAPGTTSATEWGHGPLAPGIPTQDPEGGYCYQCRTDTQLATGLEGGLDSVGHYAEIFGSDDGIPVARFRFYKNGKLVADKDDYLGSDFKVAKGKATYKATLDLDNRLTGRVQSTRSTTTYSFVSEAGVGRKLPENWYCDFDGTCRVLPVITAKVALPTSLNGQLPAGKTTVTVKAGRIQKASPGTIAAATLEYRVPGFGWQSVKLTKTGATGVYTGVIDNEGLDGQSIDVRVGATDTAKSSYSQTVLKAYTVAAAQ